MFLGGCSLSVRQAPILEQGIIIQKRHIPETTGTFEEWFLEVEESFDIDEDRMIRGSVTNDRNTIQIYSKGEYDSYEIGDYWVRPLEGK